MDRAPIVIDDLEYNPNPGEFRWLRALGNRRMGLAGGVHQHGYRMVGFRGKLHRAHRLAWWFVHGEMPELIDHINQVRDDNRIDNLRVADRAINARNSKRRATNKSGSTGVSYDRSRGKWRATLVVGGKQVMSKRFDTEELARMAYEQAVLARGLELVGPEGQA